MRKLLPTAALTALLAPALAEAQTDRCLHEKRGDEVIGALLGGGVGAVAGGASARCGQNRFGYYDDAGRWVPYRVTANGYVGPDGAWVRGAPPLAEAADTRARESGFEAALERRMDEGSVSERDGRRAMRDLEDIAAVDAAYRAGDQGRLSPDQRRDIDARLDALAARLGLGADRRAQAQ
jgi:hypothetical protein